MESRKWNSPFRFVLKTVVWLRFAVGAGAHSGTHSNAVFIQTRYSFERDIHSKEIFEQDTHSKEIPVLNAIPTRMGRMQSISIEHCAVRS